MTTIQAYLNAFKLVLKLTYDRTWGALFSILNYIKIIFIF